MDEPNFVDEVRSRVESRDGKDIEALSDDISKQVVALVQANLARILARDIMQLPEGGDLGYACTSAAFLCGAYTCTGIVSCSGDFSCTIQFSG
jgi:hypothetical protein